MGGAEEEKLQREQSKGLRLYLGSAALARSFVRWPVVLVSIKEEAQKYNGMDAAWGFK